MNKLTKHLRLATFLWVALVFSTQAMADYISVKDGFFQDTQFSAALKDPFYLKNRDGRLREVEFNWGNKKALQLTGGIRLDSNNQISNFFMGLAFDKDDQFMYRELRINDQLFYDTSFDLAWKSGPQPANYLISNIDARAQELTYIFPGGNWFVKVGQSNFPVNIKFPYDVMISTAEFAKLPGKMVAVNPRTNTLIVGVVNPLSYGQEVTGNAMFYPLKKWIGAKKSGFVSYLDHRVDLGIINQEIGQQVYSENYGNTVKGTQTVDNVGIRGMKGTDILFTIGAELGKAYLFQFGQNTAIASVALFGEMSHALSDTGLYRANNRTANGTEWTLGGASFYGINARVAMDF
jgi:hypothetical protein